MGVMNLLRHGSWNAFRDQPSNDPYPPSSLGSTYAVSARPDRAPMSMANQRTLIASIITRLAIDVASVDYRHVRLDDQGRYDSDIKSWLNECLTVEANIDQGPRDFRQDIAFTMFDKGVAAIVPVETDVNPEITSGGYDIQDLRVGEIVEWGPQKVKVSLYDDETGKRQELWLSKKTIGIVPNPLFSVMNETNSTLQRLLHKIRLLDMADEKNSSGKLDLIIQLPYAVKSEALRARADQRRNDIEVQLTGSKYGIAYADGTEKITQLNRPVENNLFQQVEYLTNKLYEELGMTPKVMNGTASEEEMLNYNHRTLEPVIQTIVEEMRRKFLTKTGRTQGQSIMYFRDPFKLVPLSQLADIIDKFSRNEVLSSNESRGVIGRKPSKEPKADALQNSNMPAPSEPPANPATSTPEGDSQNGRR